eukprot:Tbor_TRINITY_DN6579_c0_g1::TRINITY_DN6579_c0_g1_i1::g.7474::m.7474
MNGSYRESGNNARCVSLEVTIQEKDELIDALTKEIEMVKAESASKLEKSRVDADQPSFELQLLKGQLDAMIYDREEKEDALVQNNKDRAILEREKELLEEVVKSKQEEIDVLVGKIETQSIEMEDISRQLQQANSELALSNCRGKEPQDSLSSKKQFDCHTHESDKDEGTLREMTRGYEERLITLRT